MRVFADQRGSNKSAPRRSSSVASAPSRMTTGRAANRASSGRGIEPSRSAEVRAAGDEITKARLAALRNADSGALADGRDGGAVAADPQRAVGKQINPIVPQIDLQSRRQSSGSAREIEQPLVLARAAHELPRAAHMVDSGQGFEGAQQNAGAGSAPLA